MYILGYIDVSGEGIYAMHSVVSALSIPYNTYVALPRGDYDPLIDTVCHTIPLLYFRFYERMPAIWMCETLNMHILCMVTAIYLFHMNFDIEYIFRGVYGIMVYE